MGYLRATGLGKAFRRYPRRWDRLAEWLGGGPRHQLHWVLRDIDLAVQPGEAVGIVGINGAGKSTLLKLIAGTSHPTQGRIETGGRVAALLELGLGFHGEFTGRENVWIAAQLAGHDRATIASHLSDIQVFAGIGDYFDQPVRTYSSGMQVRLAFAAATAVRPDILIVDEALAVGDVFFQQKCFERIRAYRAAGTTLLFVSHAMSTVYSLCDRAILLDGGRIRHDGSAREVIDIYNAALANQLGEGDLRVADGAGDQTPGSYDNGAAVIEGVQVLHEEGPVRSLVSDSPVRVRIRVRFNLPQADPHLGFQIRDRRGEILYQTHTHGLGQRIGPVVAGQGLEVDFAFLAGLMPGDYTLTAGVGEGGQPDGALRTSLARRQDAARFTVLRNIDAPYWNGVFNLNPHCHIRRMEETRGG